MAWHAKITKPGPSCTQGSKRIGRHRTTGKPMLIEAREAQLRPWREALRVLMLARRPAGGPLPGPVAVSLRVYVARPQEHFRRARGQVARDLKPWAATLTHAPAGDDLDKVARAVGDAGQGVWWTDDRHIALWERLERLYAAPGEERVEVEAWSLDRAPVETEGDPK
jgi:hypothetical protein